MGVEIERWMHRARRHLGRLVPGQRAWVSIGTFCHAASALREAGLRQWSGPFDWIFSTPALVADAIEEDFENFLAPRYLQSVPEHLLTPGTTRQCRHLLFEERYRLPTLFNHHDPVSSQEDRETLARAIARFRSALANPRGNTFFMLSDRPRVEADLDRLERLFLRHGSQHRMVVVTLEAGSERLLRVEDGPGRRTGGVVRLLGESKGVRFVDQADNEFLRQALARFASRVGASDARSA